jgi:hypothetical protein
MESQEPTPTEDKDKAEVKEGSGEAWRDVARQFDALGKSMTEAFRLSWDNREARRYVMSGLESMAAEINRALTHGGELPPEARKLKSEVEKVAQSARVATEEAVREGRPRLLMTLRQVSGELQRLVDRLEQEEKDPNKPGDVDTT